ncbi:MAG: ABC transporter ATP-binding protein [Lachnospiraceae bacterium]|nr:ABC transporter ATP-binding protein [Lachnospiraceae bacterium]
MKRLLSYMNLRRKEAILAPLLKMLEASFELIIPLIVADMIDRGITGGDNRRILLSGGLMILLGCIGFAVSLTAQYFAAKCAVHTGTAIRSDLFRKINQLSYADLDTLGSSTLITRMTSDINQVQNGVNMVLRLLLRSPFVVAGAMIMAFTVDAQTALIFLAVIPVLTIIIFGILLGTRPLYKNVQAQLDIVTGKTRENLQGVRVVRAFNRQKQEKQEYYSASDSLLYKQLHVGKISALLNPVTVCVINLGIVCILFLGGQGVDTGRLTQGQVIALVNYMSQILVELVKLANLVIQLSRAAACVNRVDAVFSIEPDIISITETESDSKGARSQTHSACPTVSPVNEPVSEPVGPASDPYIVFDQVSFSYGNSDVPAISSVSFTAEQGETIGIIGGTGSGKSTLINLIPRLYDCSEGRILINGRDLREQSLTEGRNRVGIVPQKAVLYKGTLRSNLLMGRADASDDELFRALDISQAREFVDAKQLGLELPVEQEGRNFSGGQKQRLTIARALVRNPEILILDDSASALDFATDAKLRKAIRHASETSGSEGGRKTTVFLVSQRVSTVRDADRILVLEDGCLAGTGTHHSLLASNAVYREICRSQMSEEEIRRDLNASMKGGTDNESDR